MILIGAEETTNYDLIGFKSFLKVKGRYLNLQEGKLETTEKMYKHHVMQVTFTLPYLNNPLPLPYLPKV